MKTRFVYVLVSGGQDYFCEMTLLSLHSLRRFHPSDPIDLMVDAETARIVRERYGESPEGACLRVVSVPAEYAQKARSRFLKTRLRELVQGDFLYLDCDTIVCGSLNAIDTFPHVLGAVPDGHTQRQLDDVILIEKCRRAGFDAVKGEPYFNGGVIYAKDTPEAHRFFQSWHARWLESLSRGYDVDQPALCQANIDTGQPLRELSGSWNCQMHTVEGKQQRSDALILHYFTMEKLHSPVKERLLQDIRETGRITPAAEKVAQSPRTMGFAVFTSEMAGDAPLNEFIYSDILYTYCSIRPLYNFLCFFARALTRPVSFLIKHTR